HALVADVHRIRAAVAALGSAAKSSLGDAFGRLAQMVLRAAERVLEQYAALLDDRHKLDDELEEISLRMLETSTVERIAHDYRTLDGAARPLALALTSAVAAAGPTEAARSP